MPRYYHVIKRPEGWCLYADDALTELLCDPEVRVLLRAARAAARRDGGRVILHKDAAAEAELERLASAKADEAAAVQRPVLTRTINKAVRRDRSRDMVHNSI